MDPAITPLLTFEVSSCVRFLLSRSELCIFMSKAPEINSLATLRATNGRNSQLHQL